ncbi:CLUMA_CG008046, isoform A [Clunio marinus]|uniref:CLUMA_CG008046, isoform A n=1 Tax=Clunio marinus TaxID=568069 RepID=A0A1J1I2H2_9DIPT|nr:CLUMA_CG008046, isoform A [Clunio marinus]
MRIKTMAKRKKERLVTCCNVGQHFKRKRHQKRVFSSCILYSRPNRFHCFKLGHDELYNVSSQAQEQHETTKHLLN